MPEMHYFSEDHPDYARHQELTRKKIFEELTTGEEQELRQLDEIWGHERGRLYRRTTDGNATLENILKHDALFEAYPQLRKTRVVFSELESGKNGRYDQERDIITLSYSLRNAPENTLVHEIQHTECDIKAEGILEQIHLLIYISNTVIQIFCVDFLLLLLAIPNITRIAGEQSHAETIPWRKVSA